MARAGKSPSAPTFVAIVGSGPSGFYAAEALLESEADVRISLIEKLPVPYGLVRYGVAPDHPHLKAVTAIFHKIAQDPAVTFFGNVVFGRDITLEDLKKTHHAVIFCIGADTDRALGIKGEDLPGSYTATEFVAWYNGHPDYRDAEFDLSHEVAVVIGQGNVAADVSRILLKSVDDLRHTDIAQHALDQLAESRIREVHVVGRRGPVQAKFTSKELRELGEIQGCHACVSELGSAIGPIDEEELAVKANDNAQRCFKLFSQFNGTPVVSTDRCIQFHFLLSPMEILGSETVEGIRFVRNRLVGPAMNQRAEALRESLDMPCSLCFRSIGYRGTCVPGIPFDDRRGVILNQRGRVVDERMVVQPGIYVSGWIKRGPSGTIGSNKVDSWDTIEALLHDVPALNKNELQDPGGLKAILDIRGLNHVNFERWLMIDSAETQMGRTRGKVREKITSIDQMLAVAG